MSRKESVGLFLIVVSAIMIWGRAVAIDAWLTLPASLAAIGLGIFVWGVNSATISSALPNSHPPKVIMKSDEALIARFQDHTETLRALSQIDLQVLGGYLTLQLGFGAWLAGQACLELQVLSALGALDLVLGIAAGTMLRHNYLRRKEIVQSLENTRAVLGYTTKGTYLVGAALDSDTKFRPWWPIHLLVVATGLIGIFVLLFFGPSSGDQSKCSTVPVQAGAGR